ncbi:D-2-hydroxyacid dehydrogenase [Cytobacillus horneckiae]|nr:D-2-hydroxyacid dehydrogenase [Cytobacillus horneckiae]MCM3179449.1 D-2-hydroxyacid dehydrogenase [Cytobacillus horneckiae]MEC1154875.1 D-2-hydroxyacid dehydrogenase [Cytobacillus horneckiae]MED2936219.1 D-2-hydroxyacid dehydrogenase [Cytobacillus horneckiae]
MITVLVTTSLDKQSREKLINAFQSVTFHFFDNKNEAVTSNVNPNVLIAYADDLHEDWLKNLTNLKWIHVLTSGVNSLPFDWLMKNKSILVTNSKGIHAIPMAEYTVGAMLMLAKHFNQYLGFQKERNWNPALTSEELDGKVVSIIGTGAIGTEIAKKLKAFNTKVVGINTNGRDVSPFDKVSSMDDIDKVLSTSDFIIVTLPLTNSTKNLLSKDKLSLIKPTSYLINLARGEILDESYLVYALKEKRIKGAVLDVVEEEPLSWNNPIWELENVMITPHISDSSPLVYARMTNIIISNLLCYEKEEYECMVNQVDLHFTYYN